MKSTTSVLVVLLDLLTLPGCGGDSRPVADAMVMFDASLSLDCTTYCDAIQTNCMGVNAQYPDMAHCRAACASFATANSTVTDTSGNTLGCRVFYAGTPSKMAPAANCPLAGPAGDRISASTSPSCSGGDICTSFCTLEVQACGSLDTPLPGDPKDASQNSLYQYKNVANCVRQCANFDKTHEYGTIATGDSLACRLLQAINAAIAVDPNAIASCASTAAEAKGMCVGAALP